MKAKNFYKDIEIYIIFIYIIFLDFSSWNWDQKQKPENFLIWYLVSQIAWQTELFEWHLYHDTINVMIMK